MATVYNLTATASIGLRVTTSAYVSPIRLTVAAGFNIRPVVSAQHLHLYTFTVSASLGLTPSVTETRPRVYTFTVASGLGLQPVSLVSAFRIYSFTVSASLGLAPSAILTRYAVRTLTVSAGLGLRPIASLTAFHTYRLTVAAGFELEPAAVLRLTRTLTVQAGLGLRPSATAPAIRNFTVSSGLGLRPSALGPKTVHITVSAGLGLAPSPGLPYKLLGFTLTAGLGLHPTVAATKGFPTVRAGLGLQPSVWCDLVPPAGMGIPGIGPVGGPQNRLYAGLSAKYPLTYAQTPSGVVLMANGVDPMLRWDCFSPGADVAGVQAPATPLTLAGSGVGTITGLRYAFSRWVDNQGNYSNLSPISGGLQCGRDQSIDGITLNASSGVVTITARNHGLLTGSTIVLQGITGLPLNGQFSVSLIDLDHFSLSGVTLTQGTWLGGGAFVLGVASVTYSSLPTPSQAKIVSLQILRNLEGSSDVLYVDATTTAGSTAPVVSTLSDDLLAQQEAVVLKSADGLPLALRYGVPPANRPFIVNYLGRIFAAGDISYSEGCVSVVSGSNVVQGIGTSWPTSLTARRVFVKGSSRSYGITSVNPISQSILLDQTFTDASSSFQTYAIRSSPSDRKLLQWSEMDAPEAWPAWNALALPEDNDDVVGLFVKGTYLYIVERRHIYRFQFVDDPGRTGHIFSSAERGAIDHRVIVLADGVAFLMDESGFYSFSDGETKPISQPIQNAFHQDGLAPTYQIDWSADTTLWHASLDPVRTIVRWFVTVVGQPPLTVCFAYNYRLDRWWTEQYPTAITSSATGTLGESSNAGAQSGYRRALGGSECRSVVVLGESSLDLAADIGTLRGSVADATSTSITDALATYAPYLGGAPIAIVSGTGAGQVRLISSVSGQTVSVVQSWTTIPDVTSVYQIGGIPWEWRSGWLDIEVEEESTNRDMMVSFQPLTSETSFVIQLYYDHSTSPKLWAFPMSLDGVTVQPGSPDIRFEMSHEIATPGWRIFRETHHTEQFTYSRNFIQVYISGVTNDEVVRVYQVSLRGVDQEGL